MFSKTTILLVSLPRSCSLLLALLRALFYDKQTFCVSKTCSWKHIPHPPVISWSQVKCSFDSTACSRTWHWKKLSSDFLNFLQPKEEVWGLRLRQSSHCPGSFGPAPHTGAVCLHMASVKLLVLFGVCVLFFPYFFESQPAPSFATS